jgi:RNA polymerase sigma-70 factor (ECF subfamily)
MQVPGVSTMLDQLAAETGWLRRLARSLANDPAAADDLVHDAYVLAAEQPPGDDRPLRPWLVRVLVNLTRTRRRSAARRGAREQAVAVLAGSPATPADLVGKVELHRLLANLVLELSPMSRDVVLLHYFEDLSSAVIANRLGIAPGTVRWRLKQALDELRDGLDHREPNRAWLPALAAFGGPGRTAGAAVGWLVFAALVLLFASVWLVVLARPASDDRTIARAAQRGLSPLQATEQGASASAASGTTVAASLPLIAGRMRITGRVVDTQKHPVSGADLVLDCGFENDSAAFRRTRSDPAGAFAFDADASCMPSVLATQGDLAASALMFPSEGPSVLVLQPRLAVRVHVVDDATGAPVARADLAVSESANSLERSAAVTDASGRATLQLTVSQHPAMPVSITARSADHPLRSIQIYLSAERSRGALERTIRLSRGIAVRGHVIAPDGKPAGGLVLRIIEPGHDLDALSNDFLSLLESLRVDDDGRFAFAAAIPGTYRLLPEPIVSRAVQRIETVVEVDRGGVDGVVIQLSAAVPRLTGVVVEAGGRPVAGAQVTSPTLTGRFKPVMTDAHGRFEVHGRGRGLAVVARSGDLASEIMDVEGRRDQPPHVTLTLGRAGISGVVVDPEGLPVPGAQVWLNACCDAMRRIVEGARAIADDRGRFAIDVPRGTFRLSVRRNADDDFLDEDDRRVAGGTHDLRMVVP